MKKESIMTKKELDKQKKLVRKLLANAREYGISWPTSRSDFTENERKMVYGVVLKQLEKIQPKDLCNVLWKSGWAHTMGYSQNDNTKLWNIVSEDFEEFQGLYYAWHRICYDYSLSGKDEDFNDHIKEYYPDIDEDEKRQVADEWVDEGTYTWGAYISYITELVEKTLEEIKRETKTYEK